MAAICTNYYAKNHISSPITMQILMLIFMFNLFIFIYVFLLLLSMFFFKCFYCCVGLLGHSVSSYINILVENFVFLITI